VRRTASQGISIKSVCKNTGRIAIAPNRIRCSIDLRNVLDATQTSFFATVRRVVSRFRRAQILP
jgi:hypothetical protein